MNKEEVIELLNYISMNLDLTDMYGDRIDTDAYERVLEIAIECVRESKTEEWEY